MPQKLIRDKRDFRGIFYRQYKPLADLYEPVFVKFPKNAKFLDKVHVRRSIQEAARRKVRIVILYQKLQDPPESIEIYEVSCISYRYRKLSVGIKKVVYAWDDERLPTQMYLKMRNPGAKRYQGKKRMYGTLKNFVLDRIKSVYITDERYSRWALLRRIEIM